MNSSKYKIRISRRLMKLPMKYSLLLFTVLVCSSLQAESTNVDSLKSALVSSSTTKDRIILMNKLSEALINIDLKQSAVYARKALDLSQSLDDKELTAKVNYNLGLVLYETTERESSLEYLEKSKQLAEKLKLTELHAHSLMSIAKYHRYFTHDSTKTVNYFYKSVEVCIAENYTRGLARSYAKLASVYTRYNRMGLCEKYLELSAKYYLQTHEGEKEIAHYYNEVGDKIWDTNPKKSMELYLKGAGYSSTPQLKTSLAKVYTFIGEYEKALNHLTEAIPYFHKHDKKKRSLGIALAQLTEVYIMLENYTEADKVCDEGIKLLGPLGRANRNALPKLYRLKGLIADHFGNDKSALEYLSKSIDESNKIRLLVDRIQSMSDLGIFYLKRGDLKNAKAYCTRALENSKNSFFTYQEANACDCLYSIYKEEGSFINALKYHEQKMLLSDSLSTLKVMHVLDVNNKLTQKDKLISEQIHQKEIKDEQFNNLVLTSLVALLLILIMSFSITKIRKQNKEIKGKTKELENANKSLSRSNEELERFAHIASHDLKSPLRNIISFTGLLRNHLAKKTDPLVEDSLNFIESSGKRMNQLIVDILEYSKLSDKKTSASKHELINLNTLVEEISQLILVDIDKRSIKINASSLPKVNWNYSKFFLLFKNLIENGLKYNKSEQPTVEVDYSESGNTHTIYIKDNGIGIEREYFDKIFVMFQRLHNQEEYEGTGLGLATCKKIVDEFMGEISINSEVGKGTTFKIEIPDDVIFNPDRVKEPELMQTF